MSQEKFLVVLNDGSRESVYKGVLAKSMSDAMDIAVSSHMKIYPEVELNDIEGTSVRMGKAHGN